MVINKSTGQPMYLNADGLVTSEAKEGVPVRVDRRDPHKLVAANTSSGVSVSPISESFLISNEQMELLKVGEVEAYRQHVGFTDPATTPAEPMVALWTEFSGGEFKTHEFLIGGESIVV